MRRFLTISYRHRLSKTSMQTMNWVLFSLSLFFLLKFRSFLFIYLMYRGEATEIKSFFNFLFPIGTFGCKSREGSIQRLKRHNLTMIIRGRTSKALVKASRVAMYSNIQWISQYIKLRPKILILCVYCSTLIYICRYIWTLFFPHIFATRKNYISWFLWIDLKLTFRLSLLEVSL